MNEWNMKKYGYFFHPYFSILKVSLQFNGIYISVFLYKLSVFSQSFSQLDQRSKVIRQSFSVARGRWSVFLLLADASRRDKTV